MAAFFADFVERHHDWRFLDTETAMGAAQFFSNFYTCAETIFFRISAFFENDLEKDRWHSHLPDRMTCDIPGERPAVISPTTASLMLEFLKFRHFTRYYFEFDYDREKLAFLGAKFPAAVDGLNIDLDAFLRYVDELNSKGPQ
jgi:hypothetical protein